MKVFLSHYELKGKELPNSRKGVLLKVHFDNGSIGYADCHPWVELGDRPLAEQIDLLAAGQLTPLTRRSMMFAGMDGSARKKGIDLFSDLKIPSSHWLLNNLDEEVPVNFSLCKVKLGKHPEDELSRFPAFFSNLPENVSVRLDFNNRVDSLMFKQYLNVLQPYLDRIDFIEDPFEFNAGMWENIQSEYSIKLASDLNSEEHLKHYASHAVSVIKPAVQDDRHILQKACHKIVYTSYLDHPLGQAAAAYLASIAAKEHPEKILPCGLLSHCVYQTNKYSEALGIRGDQLVPPERGTGFGFDEQLQQEKWKELKR